MAAGSHHRTNSQHELQPMSSSPRDRAGPAPGAAREQTSAVDFGAGRHDGAAAVATGQIRSLGHDIGASIRKSRADRRRRRLGGGTWRDRSRDCVVACFRRLVIEGLLRRKPLPPSRDGRHIPLNGHDAVPDGLVDERSQKPYVSNFIRSSRYTVWDFVPKQLVFQFSRLGNFYFLVIGILQMVPTLSTVGRWTTIVPLSIFVSLSMAKEGYDDFRRYKLDRAENRAPVAVFRHGIREGQPNPSTKAMEKQEDKRRRRTMRKQKKRADAEGITLQNLDSEVALKPAPPGDDWMLMQWQDVQVGDVIRLRRDQAVPADMALLHATGLNGLAYLDTMALDGETNLKSKQVCALLAGRCNTVQGLKAMRATIVSEDPNIDLYTYDGRVTVGEETMPLSINNVLYRGSTLRNTAEAVGVVFNTGEECKIRMNANKNINAKKPAMQSVINTMILMQICIVCCIAMGLTIGYALWKRDTQDKSFYLFQPGEWNASVPFKEIFFGYLIMFNTLIPLSLYISLEIIKLGQLFLMQDVDMYDPVSNTPMVARTTTILENLGQVGHIFSDKTGTLTENLMRFRKMSVAGLSILHDMDVPRDEGIRSERVPALAPVERGKRKRPARGSSDDGPIADGSPPQAGGGAASGRNAPRRASLAASLVSRRRSSAAPDEMPELRSEDVLEYVRDRPNTAFSRKIRHFLLCMALCHTCLPEVRPDGAVDFQAASPDELALVEAAKDLGYLLVDRTAQAIELQIRHADGSHHVETYQTMGVLEFTSKRKRMSVILKTPDGRICVVCKGADNVVVSRLKLRDLAEEKVKDTNRRSDARRAVEREKAMQRISEHHERVSSVQSTPRSSITLQRKPASGRLEASAFGLGRRSTDRSRLSQSEAVSTWLHDRVSGAAPASPRASADGARSSRRGMGRMSLEGGAEASIDETLAADDAGVFEKCFRHVDEFASEGLRTLLYAYRYIDETVYSEWEARHREAETSLVGRQERVEEVAELIERDFELAGATAIEDKLQEGVPDTIEKLGRANIKVWMLTGDKRETAINIGHSARVCKAFSEMFTLDVTQGDLRETLTASLNDVARGLVAHSVVVVDGQTLSAIDSDDDLAVLFYDLAIRVDSVICCRSSPAQKAGLVQSMRRYVPKSVTLAIGDGANDIGMIQASHVGIGVSGREGLQAARTADYSIAQFRFLQKLLFVHGRWNYLRTGKYVLGTFWKEMLFFLVQAHYQRFDGYTGTSLFESWSLTVFNTFFTSLPVILLGIFERDLQAETLLAVPELYTFGQEGKGFSFFQYFGWMLMAVAGSFVNFYFTWAVYDGALFTEDTTLYAVGCVCFSVGVIFINVKLLILEVYSKTVVMLIGFLVSVGGWFVWMCLLSGVYKAQMAEYLVHAAFIDNFGREAVWWVTVVLGVVTLTVVELVVQAVRRVYWPTDQDMMQRIERDAGVSGKEAKAALGRAEDLDAPPAEAVEMQVVVVSKGQAGLSSVRDGGAWGGANGDADLPRRSYEGDGATGLTPLSDNRENPFEIVHDADRS